MLNRHSLIAIPEETWYFPQLAKELPEILKGDDWRNRVATRVLQLNSLHFPDLEVHMLENALANTERSNVPDIIAVVNREFMLRQGKKRWGDKTPGYVRDLKFIKQIFPQAKIIHLVRDGRDVVPSILRYWSVGPQTNDFVETAFYWKKHVLSGLKDGSRTFGSNYIELRYEDLVTQPEYTVRRICDFIGEGFESEMLASSNEDRRYTPNWEWHTETTKEINSDNVFKWRGSLNDYQIFVIQLIAGRILRRFSYEIVNAFSLKAFFDVVVYLVNFTRKQNVYQIKAFLYRVLKGSLING